MFLHFPLFLLAGRLLLSAFSSSYQAIKRSELLNVAPMHIICDVCMFVHKYRKVAQTQLDPSETMMKSAGDNQMASSPHSPSGSSLLFLINNRIINGDMTQ